MSDNKDTKREMLRHTVATLAYRGAKAATWRAGVVCFFQGFSHERARRGDPGAHWRLLDWALSIAKGKETWNNAEPLAWDQRGVSAFHTALQSFDDYLDSDAPLDATCERLFQGPIADDADSRRPNQPLSADRRRADEGRELFTSQNRSRYELGRSANT
jgi:hypothetical protein